MKEYDGWVLTPDKYAFDSQGQKFKAMIYRKDFKEKGPHYVILDQDLVDLQQVNSDLWIISELESYNREINEKTLF